MWLFVGVVIIVIIFVWLNSDHLSHAPIFVDTPKISVDTPQHPRVFSEESRFQNSLDDCITQKMCGSLGTHETRDCQMKCWLYALNNSPLPPMAKYVDPITRKMSAKYPSREHFGGVYLDGVYNPSEFLSFTTTARPTQACFYR